MSDDLLDALLREAQREQALTPETLDAFAQALRARAERVLAERVRPLEERLALLEGEKARFQQHHDAQNAEIEGVRAQHRSSSEAHDRLHAHHCDVIRTTVAALEPLSAELPWGYARVRARLQELLASLRRELE